MIALLHELGLHLTIAAPCSSEALRQGIPINTAEIDKHVNMELPAVIDTLHFAGTPDPQVMRTVFAVANGELGQDTL